MSRNPFRRRAFGGSETSKATIAKQISEIQGKIEALDKDIARANSLARHYYEEAHPAISFKKKSWSQIAVEFLGKIAAAGRDPDSGLGDALTQDHNLRTCEEYEEEARALTEQKKQLENQLRTLQYAQQRPEQAPRLLSQQYQPEPPQCIAQEPVEHLDTTTDLPQTGIPPRGPLRRPRMFNPPPSSTPGPNVNPQPNLAPPENITPQFGGFLQRLGRGLQDPGSSLSSQIRFDPGQDPIPQFGGFLQRLGRGLQDPGTSLSSQFDFDLGQDFSPQYGNLLEGLGNTLQEPGSNLGSQFRFDPGQHVAPQLGNFLERLGHSLQEYPGSSLSSPSNFGPGPIDNPFKR
jgi:hypothetical protein